MKARLIINPSSGRQVFQKNAVRIIEKLVSNHVLEEVSTLYTEKAGDGHRFASEMEPGEFDFVVAVGGDGTVNEVVNGLISGGSKTPLAIIPAGTVNDFAGVMCLPKDVDSFCEMIENFRTETVDVGKVNDRYFLNVAAAGMMTDIAYKIPSDAKTVWGRLAYYIGGAMTLPAQLYRNIPLYVQSEETSVVRESLLFTVSNSPSIGGFKKAAPRAKVNDGLLDVLIVHKPVIGDVMPFLMQFLRGEHDQNAAVTYFQTARLRVEADMKEPVQMDVDGEMGGVLPVTIECVPSALRLIVPAGVRAEGK